jgi:hypothetical protein
MDSADFCSIRSPVTGIPAACVTVGFCGLSIPFEIALSQTPIVTRPHVEQISPDKNVNCPCTTVSFTVSPEP